MFPNNLPTEPGSTGQRLIVAIARHGHLTIADLVDHLGVTTTAVRQQVNRLLADGWLVRDRRHGVPGRPADVFSLSEKTKRMFGGLNDELSKLLLEEIAHLEGPARSRTILRSVGRRMAEHGRAFIGAGPPAERLQRLADLLSHEGVLAETRGPADNLRLTVFTCPYRGLASEHPEVCEMERETFSALLGGPVRRNQCVREGHERCEFSVLQPPGDAPRTPATEL
jgi:DeoR family transcriptional regulator, suf operon transcriptional repressor